MIRPTALFTSPEVLLNFKLVKLVFIPSTQQSQGTYSSGTESSIGKSFRKYSDAVQLGIVHSSSYNMGRALLLRGDHETALGHLKTALGIKPIHMETRCALY